MRSIYPRHCITPQPFSLPIRPKERTGKELLYWLEDNYSDYRHGVCNRLCEDDPKVHLDYKAKISAARAALKA